MVYCLQQNYIYSNLVRNTYHAYNRDTYVQIGGKYQAVAELQGIK